VAGHRNNAKAGRSAVRGLTEYGGGPCAVIAAAAIWRNYQVPVVTQSAELDSTSGPHLLSKADRSEVVFMSNPRAVRYRRLALTETDPAKAQLLQTIADEAERGVLVTSEIRQAPAVSIPVTVDKK